MWKAAGRIFFKKGRPDFFSIHKLASVVSNNDSYFFLVLHPVVRSGFFSSWNGPCLFVVDGLLSFSFKTCFYLTTPLIHSRLPSLHPSWRTLPNLFFPRLRHPPCLSSSAPLWVKVRGWYEAEHHQRQSSHGWACLTLRHREWPVADGVAWYVSPSDLWPHCLQVRGLQRWGIRVRRLRKQRLEGYLSWLDLACDGCKQTNLWHQRASYSVYCSSGNVSRARKGTMKARH